MYDTITFETLQLYENFFSKLYFHFTILPNLKNSSNFYNQYYYTPFPVSKLLFLVSYHHFKHPFPVQIQIKNIDNHWKIFSCSSYFFSTAKKTLPKNFFSSENSKRHVPKGLFSPFERRFVSKKK